jgi:hypothetical protein
MSETNISFPKEKPDIHIPKIIRSIPKEKPFDSSYDAEYDEYLDSLPEIEFYEEIYFQIYYLLFVLTDKIDERKTTKLEDIRRKLSIEVYGDKDKLSFEERLIKVFRYITTKVHVGGRLPNIFHLLAQGKLVTNRTGPLRHIKFIGTLGRDYVKYQDEIGTINKKLCDITKSPESMVRNFLRENKKIQDILKHKVLFSTTNEPLFLIPTPKNHDDPTKMYYSPEDIANMNKNTDGACFIDNILVRVEAEATILPPPIADVVSTDKYVNDEDVQNFPGGKSRRSRKQKKRASKSKKSKKSRKTARKQ